MIDAGTPLSQFVRLGDGFMRRCDAPQLLRDRDGKRLRRGTSMQFTQRFRVFDRSNLATLRAEVSSLRTARRKSETRRAYLCGPDSEIACSARNTLA